MDSLEEYSTDDNEVEEVLRRPGGMTKGGKTLQLLLSSIMTMADTVVSANRLTPSCPCADGLQNKPLPATCIEQGMDLLA